MEEPEDEAEVGVGQGKLWGGQGEATPLPHLIRAAPLLCPCRQFSCRIFVWFGERGLGWH